MFLIEKTIEKILWSQNCYHRILYRIEFIFIVVAILVYLGWIFSARIYMTDILKPKVEASGIVDLLLIGVSKQVTEKLAIPVVGNGTPVSALAKGLAGGVLHGKGGKIGHYVSSGLLIDAAEDGAVSVMNMLGLSNVGGQSRETENS